MSEDLYVAVHEIIYKDELTGESARIAPGSTLTKEHIKSLGSEEIERMVKSKAIKRPKAAKPAEDGPSIQHTQVDDDDAGNGDGFGH